MTDAELWEKDRQQFGWEMPETAWWKRLPGIRHIRCAYHKSKVDRHNHFWSSLGSIPTGYDSWVLFGMAMGKERTKHKRGKSESHV